MRAACIQIDIRRGDVPGNLQQALEGLEAAAKEGAQLVVLPEMWPTSFAGKGRGQAGGSSTEGPEFDPWGALLGASESAVEALAKRAAELDVWVAGSALGRSAAGLPTNRLQIFSGGREVMGYDKVHLFSPTAEDLSFSAGALPPKTVAAPFGRISGSICYDLRFPELMSETAQDGAELMVVPAQWPDTRISHWRTLVLGRAVEGQCFVIAANRSGKDQVGRKPLDLTFSGCSIIADPHGNVLSEGRQGQLVVSAELDLDVVKKIRRRVPVQRDARRDLYASWNEARSKHSDSTG